MLVHIEAMIYEGDAYNDWNHNGCRLKNLCREKELCMPQTYFNYPAQERYTWYSNDGKTQKILDYVLVEKYVQQYITDCAVHQNCHVETDHRLLVTSLTTPMSKKARWKAPSPKREKKLDKTTERQYICK